MKTSKKVKIVVVILIIGAGLIGSYFIVKNSAPAINVKKEGELVEKMISEATAKNPIQWIGENDLSGNDNNFTQSLAEGIFEQIKSDNFNPDNKDTFDGNSINLTSGKTISMAELLQKKMGELNFVSISDLKDAELKISRDNSKEAKSQYLKSIIEISQKHFSGFDKTYLEVIIDVYQKLDVSSAIQIAKIYKNITNDYLNLNVPSDWLDFHKTIIVHFKNSETIYQAMANYLTDSIKGYLAWETVESVVDNAVKIQEMISQKIKENL